MYSKTTRRFPGSIMPVVVIFLLLVRIQVTVSIIGILVEEPENKAALINKTTTLKCKSDSGRKLLWHLLGNNSEEVEVWSGYFLNPKACSCCKIHNNESGKYNLEITARKETAHMFRCTEPGTLMRSSADLIVIESELSDTCTYNETSSVVTLSCAISFYGRWVPHIKWKNTDGEQVNETSVIVENGKVTSTFIIHSNQLKTHEIYYTAYVYFNESTRPAEVTATNVPSYTDEWNSPPVRRMHGDSQPNVVAIAVVLPLCCMAGICGSVVVYMIKKPSKNAKNDVQPNRASLLSPDERKAAERSVPKEKDNA